MQKKILNISFFLIIIIFFIDGKLFAVSPQFWENESIEDVRNGEQDGTVIGWDATISLSPSSKIIANFDYPVFSILPIDEETYLVGTGNKSNLYRVKKGQKADLIKEEKGFSIPVIIKGPDNRYYFSNQHDQSISVLTKTGKMETFCSVPEKYIWDMVWDNNGFLYVATGDKARIYRFNSKGKGKIYFKSDEKHIMKLALTLDSNIVAGTDGNCLVYLITGFNKARILYNSFLSEISDIAVADDGAIFFSAISSSTVSPIQANIMKNINNLNIKQKDFTTKPSVTISDELMSLVPPGQKRLAGGKANKSELYYIPSNYGTPRRVWTCQNGLIFSLAFDKKERLLVGTGQEAALYRFSRSFKPEILYKYDCENVLKLISDNAGNTFIGTSEPNRLIKIESKYAQKGTFISEPIDSQISARWGTLSFRSINPKGTRLGLQFRTGNAPEPDQTWTEWSSIITNSDSSTPLKSPLMRYSQWKAILKSTSGDATPILENVTISYQQENLPPVIYQFKIVKSQKQNSIGKKNGVLRKFKNLQSIFQNKSNLIQRQRRFQSPPAALNSEKDFLIVQWDVTDPNEDSLSFDLFIKSQNIHATWLPLAKQLTAMRYRIDKQLLPDGIYSLKLIASDINSNPSSEALTTEQLLPFITVDNTAPIIKIDKILEKTKGNMQVKGAISDEVSSIISCEYAINGEGWFSVKSADNIYDQKQEYFNINLNNMEKGEYFLIIRAKDIYGNICRKASNFIVK